MRLHFNVSTTHALGLLSSFSIPGIADQKNLMPMYQKLHSSIRKIDDNHILFFEPTIIITSVIT